jgi:hypothetical protein
MEDIQVYHRMKLSKLNEFIDESLLEIESQVILRVL